MPSSLVIIQILYLQISIQTEDQLLFNINIMFTLPIDNSISAIPANFSNYIMCLIKSMSYLPIKGIAIFLNCFFNWSIIVQRIQNPGIVIKLDRKSRLMSTLLLSEQKFNKIPNYTLVFIANSYKNHNAIEHLPFARRRFRTQHRHQSL